MRLWYSAFRKTFSAMHLQPQDVACKDFSQLNTHKPPTSARDQQHQESTHFLHRMTK